MSRRDYGQFCGLVKALELVGERWALVIIRDLFVGPRRFTELRRGLPRIPTNVLAQRLRELEAGGIVRRRVLPRPESGVVYELTEYGNDLEEVVMKLGVWGARSMTVPRPTDIVTPDSLVIAMRATFRPERADGLSVSYEVGMGPILLGVRVHEGKLTVTQGPLPDADVRMEVGPLFRSLLAGEVTPDAALESGQVQVTGDPSLLHRFVDLFHIPPAPVSGG
jgi:DNA-binding HxlR family transcriptional regulator